MAASEVAVKFRDTQLAVQGNENNPEVILLALEALLKATRERLDLYFLTYSYCSPQLWAFHTVSSRIWPVRSPYQLPRKRVTRGGHYTTETHV